MKILLQIISQEIQQNELLQNIMAQLQDMNAKLDQQQAEMNEIKAKARANEELMSELKRQQPELMQEEETRPTQGLMDLEENHKKIIYNKSITGTSKAKNINLNHLFDKPQPQLFDKTIHFVPPQIVSYSQALNSEKQIYNHITRTYLKNLSLVCDFLNTKPFQEPKNLFFDKNLGYCTQKLVGINKLVAMPGTNPKLIATAFNYGLLNVVYTQDGEELGAIPEVKAAVRTYLGVTHAKLIYVRFYSAPAEISFDQIKPPIHVVKIGLTRDMIIPEAPVSQQTLPVEDLPKMMQQKRVVNLKIIYEELYKIFTSENPIWKYYSKDQTLIYSMAKIKRDGDLDEVRNWLETIVRPDEQPKTRAIKKDFISEEAKPFMCKVFNNVSYHQCSHCGGKDDIIPDVTLQ